MPSTWMLITKPMTSSVAPPWCMCSGVITITATITACASGQRGDAGGDPGRVRTTSTDPAPRRRRGAGARRPGATAASRATQQRVGAQEDRR